MRIPRFLPLAALAALAACAASPPAPPPRPDCGLAGRTELSLLAAAPFPLMRVEVGEATLRLVVDTGDAETVLSEAAARRAHLAPDYRHSLRATGVGGTAVYPTARAGSLLAGPLQLGPATVTLLPRVPVGDGNLGMNVLGADDLDLDLPAGRIALWHGTLCPGALPPWPQKASEVPAVPVVVPGVAAGARPHQMLLRIRLDGHDALALLDTGSDQSLVRWSFAVRAGVSETALAGAEKVRLSGLSPEESTGRMWRFRSLAVGGGDMRDPTLLVAHLPGAPFDVLLGNDFLATHRVWLSYRSQRAFVAPAP